MVRAKADRNLAWTVFALLALGCASSNARPAPMVVASIERPFLIAVESTRIYVAQNALAPGASVWSFDLSGGNAKQIASCACAGLALDDRPLEKRPPVETEHPQERGDPFRP